MLYFLRHSALSHPRHILVNISFREAVYNFPHKEKFNYVLVHESVILKSRTGLHDFCGRFKYKNRYI